MGDFSFESFRDLRRDPAPELSSGSLPSLRPLDETLLSSISSLSAPNPRYETLVGLLHGMGLSAPTPQLGELWKWFSTAPHNRELVQSLTDKDLVDLAARLDARIILFREANEAKLVGYTFQIQPLDPQFRSVVFSFRRLIDVPPMGERSMSGEPRDSFELTIKPLQTVEPGSQVAALREALRLLGVTRAVQVEREGPRNFSRPSSDIGLDRVDFMRQSNPFCADLGEQYRIGQMVKCILCEDVGKTDFEFVLSMGKREFQRETLRRLWDEWVEARPHSADRALVMTDRELRSAARQVSGSVGLWREATREGVSYGLQTMLLGDKDVGGMRIVVAGPSRDPHDDGGVPPQPGQERMLMRVLGAPGIFAATQARMMTHVMRGVAPEFRPAPGEPLPEIVDLGKSSILCSRNVRLFLNRDI